MRVSRGVALLLTMVLRALPAAAQDDRASVAGGVAATNFQSTTTVSFSAAFEYRFGPIVGLEIEASVVPTLKGPFPEEPLTIQSASTGLSRGSILQIFPSPSLTNLDGRMVVFTNAVRLRIPTGGARIEPFFVAGGGAASVRRTADLVYSIPILATPPVGVPIPPPSLRTISQHVTASEVDLALTIGGGVSIRATRRVSVDADLRMLRLMGAADRNVGRFGVSARYIF